MQSPQRDCLNGDLKVISHSFRMTETPVCIFTFGLDTAVRCEKYPSKLDISRSLIRIFTFGLDAAVRCEKYSSKLDISRSLIRIFEINLQDFLHSR